MSGVPYTFASATSSIPLSQLDANFATNATLGNATVGLGNTTTSVGNLTVSNVTINGLSGGGANGVVYINSSNVATASSSVLALDGNGNLGLGVSPSAWGSGRRAIQLFGSSTATYFAGGAANTIFSTNYFVNSTPADAFIANGYASYYQQNFQGAHQWFTSSVSNSSGAGANATMNPLMTLTNGGALCVGQTSGSSTLNITGPEATATFTCTSTGAAHTIVNFYQSSTFSGYIQVNGSSTTYNSASDYRLKNNVAGITNAIDTVMKLRPVTFNWNDSGREDNGFIAHELQEIFPNAVGGKKDDVDADGNPKYQGIDQSKIVATLTAAIQEQQALIVDLQARLAKAGL
jgi:Chaperone of endosialidase